MDENLKSRIKADYKKLKHEKKTIKHVIRVCKLCGKFIDAKIPLNQAVLMEAAMYHDIAKVIRPDDNHHKRKMVSIAIEELGMEDISEDVLDVIEAHKEDFSPEDYPLEAAILRVCDKLDKYRQVEEKRKEKRAFVEAVLACSKTMEKITDHFLQIGPIRHADMFYREYAKIHNRLAKKANPFKAES